MGTTAADLLACDSLFMLARLSSIFSMLPLFMLFIYYADNERHLYCEACNYHRSVSFEDASQVCVVNKCLYIADSKKTEAVGS